MRLHRPAIVAAVLVVLAAVLPGGRRAADEGSRVARLDCRGACFAFATLSCASVEVGCGVYQGIFVLGGLPFDCDEVEPVACRLRVGDGRLDAGDALAACLAVCGGEDYPWSGG